MQKFMRLASLKTGQLRLIVRLKFEQRLDLGDRRELGFLRSNGRSQWDGNAPAFDQRQHESDRIGRKIRLDGCNCADSNLVFSQIAAPIIRPIQKIAIQETLVMPY